MSAALAPAWLAAPPVAVRTLYLHPGRVLVSAEPVLLTTILGSCVAMCLWDDVAGLGGVNHFLLAEASEAGGSPRYARPAFVELRDQLVALGASPWRLRAKLFGGASLNPGASGASAIGLRNVEAARRLLEQAPIPVLAEDVGGCHGRKLIFETHTGHAWVRALAAGRP